MVHLGYLSPSLYGFLEHSLERHKTKTTIHQPTKPRLKHVPRQHQHLGHRVRQLQSTLQRQHGVFLFWFCGVPENTPEIRPAIISISTFPIESKLIYGGILSTFSNYCCLTALRFLHVVLSTLAGGL